MSKKLSKEQIEAVFAKFDGNGDGKLSKEYDPVTKGGKRLEFRKPLYGQSKVTELQALRPAIEAWEQRVEEWQEKTE